MSFTTRCPACGTMFKVVPDQLKISDGWVRCGHCSDVFDATLYLEGEDPVPRPAPVAPSDPFADANPPGPGPVQAPHTSHDDDDGDWLLKPQRPQAGDVTPTEPWVAAGFQSIDGGSDSDSLYAAAPEPDGWSDADPWSASSTPPERDPWRTPSSFVDELKQFASGGQVAPNDRPAPESGAVSEPVVRAPEPKPAVWPEPPAEAATAVDGREPGFVRQARRKAFWQSRSTRAALALVSVFLGGLLLLQWAVHERDRLAAQFPSSIPWLTGLCRPLACQLGPVRQIESVVIDSSNLVRRLGNFYSFDLVLKNSAPVAVAVPALELSLTDTRDAVVSRRVFLPAEWPGSPALLPARGSLSVSLRLSIADSGVSSMTGYRALVFYP